MSNKQNKIVLKSARKRGQLYAEAQVAIIEEKRNNLRGQQEHSEIKEFKTVKALFTSFSHKKPNKYKQLYYKILSRNHILDVSDISKGSPITLLDIHTRESITSLAKTPETEEKYFD
ncbi:hypothetical protein PS6_001867 [Mucor atramentarius]